MTLGMLLLSTLRIIRWSMSGIIAWAIGNSHNLRQGKFLFDIRKRDATKWYGRLPRETVAVPSLETSKTHWVKAPWTWTKL